MEAVFKGKNVLLVDDSIVRGTTMAQIVGMVRAAGAKKVYLASAAPPVRYANVYGVDMPSKKEFAANGLTEDEVRAPSPAVFPLEPFIYFLRFLFGFPIAPVRFIVFLFAFPVLAI
jgi:translation initiation factor IF-2